MPSTRASSEIGADRAQSAVCGVLIAAPASGSGKTTVTLGLLRAFSRDGTQVRPFKVGPDYIDPGFHARAAGTSCANLDAWAMRPAAIAARIGETPAGSLVVCEGVMGLFDGATATQGSSADIAEMTGWPVVLVVDAARQAASVAAVVRGFAGHRDGVRLAGAIFNRVASPRHRRHIADAMASMPDVPVLGFLPPNPDLGVPSRHLGLVQAQEIDSVEAMIEAAADHVAEHLDLNAIRGLADGGMPPAGDVPSPAIPPLGQRIALADDAAFAFTYPHVLAGWRRAGVEVLSFSPLAGDGVPMAADAIYLPGGYPELHAGRIAGNEAFMAGLRDAAARRIPVFGECGGYMVLGDGLTDADGVRHAMAGLLPVETSFAGRRLHLGYRRAAVQVGGFLGKAGTAYRAHEFHYASIVTESDEGRLFDLEDAFGDPQPPTGHVRGSVAGSFIHLIDREDG